MEAFHPAFSKDSGQVPRDKVGAKVGVSPRRQAQKPPSARGPTFPMLELKPEYRGRIHGAEEPQDIMSACKLAVVLLIGTIMHITSISVSTAEVADSSKRSDAKVTQHDWWPTRQYSWTDVWIAIATTVYVVVSARQWWILKASLAETRRSNLLSLRAWVAVSPNFGLTLPIQNPVAISATFINVGRLPAINVLPNALVEVVAPPPAWPRPSPAAIETDAVVIPSEQSVGYSTPPKHLSPGELHDVNTGARALVVTIEATYTDPVRTSGRFVVSAFYRIADNHFQIIGNTVA